MSNLRRHFNDDKSDCNQLCDEKNGLSGRIWAYAQLGMHKEAVDECKKLVRIDPNDPSSFIELGFNYEENGEIKKAIKYYKYAIKRFPKYSCTYINLGYCFEKYKKRNDMAITCYEKALELNPNDEWALNNIGAILQKEGRWKEALSYYEKAYEVSKKNDGTTNYQIAHNLAWAYYRCKNYKKAWLIYDYLANKGFDNAAVYGDFGCVNYKMKRFNDALVSFEKALVLCSESRHYRRLWKVALIKC